MRDAEWSGLKMVVVWTSVVLAEMERSEQWRVCYGGRATGFADALGGRKRKECEQQSIDLESWTTGYITASGSFSQRNWKVSQQWLNKLSPILRKR